MVEEREKTEPLSPKSYDDYYRLGGWLIYKKMVIILFILLLLILVFLLWWFSKPPKPFAIPTFYLDSNELKVYSGEAILLDKKNIVRYRGQISGGLRFGKGCSYDASGQIIYAGDFIKERYEGIGDLYTPNGDNLYSGEFLADKYHGRGVLWNNGKLLYEGEFVNGLYDGEGIEYDERGNLLFSGSHKQGKRHGQGLLVNDTGSTVYQGEFQEGFYHGKGIEFDSNGNLVFSGSYNQGKWDGQGLLLNEIGSAIYEGEFRDGLYDGEGKLYAEDGIRLFFEGKFIQGVPSREGRIFNLQGQCVYDGAVLNGQVDFHTLLGRSLKEVRAQLLEIPVIYYDSTKVGFIYRELGLALLLRYDHSALQELNDKDFAEYVTDPISDETGIDIFFSPEDNLVVSTILVDDLIYSTHIPRMSEEVVEQWLEISGFEAFLTSRLVPNSESKFEALVSARGEFLYEVSGLPDTVKFNGEGVYSNEIYYIWKSGDFFKGREPDVIHCYKIIQQG